MEIVRGDQELTDTKSLDDQLIIDEENEKLEVKAAEVAKMHNLKSKKKVFYISVFDEDNEDEDCGEEGKWLGGWVRKPNLSDFSMFTKMAESDKIKALQTILNTVWLQGDDRILNEDELLMSAMLQVEPIMNVFASKIKKF